MLQVLIVEDSPDDLKKLVAIMKANGYGTIAATDGEEGLKLALSKKPDLILLDIVMPGINGFRVARTLKKGEETKNIPIIVVTTKVQETDRVWAQRQGVDAYLTKPIDAGELKKIIERLVG